jgi:branched-chain amino acid transport system permease protein
VYGAAGTGITLLWRTTRVLNLAHGAFVMLGAYVTFGLWQRLRVDPFLSIPICMAAMFGLGWVLRRPVATPRILITFGLGLALVDLSLNLFGPDVRSIQTAYSGGLQGRTFTFVAALALVFLARLLAARVRPERFQGLLIAISIALAGAAGSLTAVDFSFTPTTGVFYTPVAVAVCLLGGMGSIPGAFAGGIALGIAATLTDAVFGPGWQNTVVLGLLLVGLLLRPKPLEAGV